MTFDELAQFFTDLGCTEVYVKKLAANDNSKNQVYLARGSFDILNIFPLSDVYIDDSDKGKRERFKATVPFYWITDDFTLAKAPNSKFILYPDYPEIRFSGFLQNCPESPSHLMTGRESGRLLFLSVTSQRNMVGYVSAADSNLTNEFINNANYEIQGLLLKWQLVNSRAILLSELKRIHSLGWIDSKRLDRDRNLLGCNSPNCGGYTLEAELGILPNGKAKPDFMGWEIKQFSVTNFEKLGSSRITLMTPEPTGGYYGENGYQDFVRKYGYADKKGRQGRMNFGGVHKIGLTNKLTKLRMELIGFDVNTKQITNADGKIALIDHKDREAASWPFSSLLEHWTAKHNQACYVPSICDKEPNRRYKYGHKVVLGEKTGFDLFLTEMAKGKVFYDPGIKVEAKENEGKSKPRSQFRTVSSTIFNLYNSTELVTVT